MKILFIEDDECVSQLAKTVFLKTSHDVVMCPSPSEAIKVLNQVPMDLVILDMNFPEGSGQDVLEYITYNKINTPVFIYSGCLNSFANVIDHYRSTGIIKEIFAKPAPIFGSMMTKINSLSNPNVT